MKLVQQASKDPESVRTLILEQLLLILRQQLSPVVIPKAGQSEADGQRAFDSLRIEKSVLNDLTKLYQT